MHLHLFDIDGTLTQFYHSEDDSFGELLRAILDVPASYNYQKEVTHFTDSAALDHTYRRFTAHPPTQEEIHMAQRCYLQILESKKDQKPHLFDPIPGAKNFIEHHLQTPQTITAVATGNWAKVAAFKLKAIGINPDQLEIIGADEHFAKTDFVGAILASIRQKHGLTAFSSAHYYGDSPYDHQAAQNNGLDFKGIDFKANGRLSLAGIAPVFRDFLEMMLDQATNRD